METATAVGQVFLCDLYVHYQAMEGGDRQVTRVVIRDGESPESLLRRFRKRVTSDGILSSVKKKRFFVSKSELRRLARRKAVRRERKRQWREARRNSRS